MLIDHLVEVEEARLGDACLSEDLDSCAFIVGEEPSGADGYGLGFGADFGRVLLQRVGEFLGGDEEIRKVSGGSGEKGASRSAS